MYRCGSLTNGARTRRHNKTPVRLHLYHQQQVHPAAQQLHHLRPPLWPPHSSQPVLLLWHLLMVQLPLLPWQARLLLQRCLSTGHLLQFLCHKCHPALHLCLRQCQLLCRLLPVLKLPAQCSLDTPRTLSKAWPSYQSHCSCLTPISMGILQSQVALCLLRPSPHPSGRPHWSKQSDPSLSLQLRLSQCSALSTIQHHNPTRCLRLHGSALRSPGSFSLLSIRHSPSRLHNRMQGIQEPTCLHSSQLCLSMPALLDQQ